MTSQSKHSEYNLTSAQVRALIDSPLSERDRLILTLYAYTAMRRAELCSLRVEDIDFGRTRILIRNGKGGKSRMVFVPAAVAETLSAFLGDRKEGWIFPGRKGRPITVRTANNVVASAGRRASLVPPNPHYRNITPHLLRHSFARNWKRARGSLESLQKVLGHSSFSTTMDLYGTEGLDEAQDNYCGVIESVV